MRDETLHSVSSDAVRILFANRHALGRTLFALKQRNATGAARIDFVNDERPGTTGSSAAT
jgi:hypothetical protein